MTTESHKQSKCRIWKPSPTGYIYKNTPASKLREHWEAGKGTVRKFMAELLSLQLELSLFIVAVENQGLGIQCLKVLKPPCSQRKDQADNGTPAQNHKVATH